jgi:hypothetical protein
VQALDENVPGVKQREPGNQSNQQKGEQYRPNVHIPSFAEQAVVRPVRRHCQSTSTHDRPVKQGRILHSFTMGVTVQNCTLLKKVSLVRFVTGASSQDASGPPDVGAKAPIYQRPTRNRE